MYEDIIGLPHYQSNKRPHMSIKDRAAQFSPFAALTGHDEAIKETARLTDKKIELTDSAKERLNEKLRMLSEKISDLPEISIMYFVADQRKQGGKYVEYRGKARKIDTQERAVIFTDKTIVPIEDILTIESDILRE